MTSRKRFYYLYSPGETSPYVTPWIQGWWRENAESWWLLQVRAYSARQARHLASRRIRAREPGGVGVVEIRPPLREWDEEP